MATERKLRPSQTASLVLLEEILERKRPYMIVAPPRSASTALARSLSNNSRVGSYIHEPCDLFRHQGAPIESIIGRLKRGGVSRNSLIKEMTFQLGDGEVAQTFLRNGKQPLVFLIRAPRLTIESRVRMVIGDLLKEETTSSSQKTRIKKALRRKDYRGLDDVLTERIFPPAYTGWMALARQIGYCSREGIDYVVLSAAAFRSRPRRYLKKLCARWQLKYEAAMIDWKASKNLPLGALSEQSAWYSRVLTSPSVLPETESSEESCLPPRFQSHLREANQVYRRILDDPNVL